VEHGTGALQELVYVRVGKSVYDLTEDVLREKEQWEV
jgi:hypothetical protein